MKARKEVRMGKKVLVTGACGFIGSHLVDKLICDGYEVVATDLPEPPDYFLNKKDFKKFLSSKAVFIPADLTCGNDVFDLFTNKKMRGVETVFHAAAMFNFFKDVCFNNVRSTANVCQAFDSFFSPRKRMILFSSGVVGNEILGSSKYGVSKWQQEEYLRDFLFFDKSSFEAIIVRPAAVFGPRSRYGLGKVIKMLAGGQLQFFIGKKGLRASVIYVDDVVDAVIRLAEAPLEKLKEATGGMNVPVFDLESNDVKYMYEELMKYAVDIIKESQGTKIIPIHLPVWLMKMFTRWQEFLAKLLKRQPKATTDALDFFRAPMKMDNLPAQEAGVWFRINTLSAMEYTINWYKKEGWI